MIVWWLGSIILCVVFIFIGIVVVNRTYDEDLGFNLVFVLCVVLFASDLFCGIHSFFNIKNINIRHKYNEKLYVRSIEDNFKTSGVFVLGSGGFGSDLYYYVMVGNDNDGYTITKFKAEDTYLIPEENIQPYYIEKHKIYDTVFATNYIFGGLFKPMKPWLNQDVIEKRELHLPKNYIKQTYNIDMK